MPAAYSTDAADRVGEMARRMSEVSPLHSRPDDLVPGSPRLTQSTARLGRRAGVAGKAAFGGR